MKLGIKSKLLIMLLCVSIASIMVVSVLAYFQSRDALSTSVTNQLRAGRATLTGQIDAYFDTIEGQTRTQAQNPTLVEATLEFAVGWDQLDEAELSAAEAADLNREYETFISTLPDRGEGETVAEYEPDAANAQYLQYQYLVQADASDRAATDDAGDGTFYSRAHRRYHPALHNFVEQFGYYDLFLIDADTGDILYSVEKEVDFATNLQTGPHRNSNLARLVADVRANPEPGRVVFHDYEFYAPSAKAPAAFVASPIVNPTNDEVVGVLALQLPVDVIDGIMTAGRQWQDVGFGDTGESYLIGPDGTMRSSSRPFIEAPQRYLGDVQQRGLDQETSDLIDLYQSTTLLQPIDTEASRRALNGITDTRVTFDYLGRETLSSFAPIDLGGLRWAIVTQIDLEQANEPVNDLQRQLLIATGVIVLVLTALAMLLSAVFVRPINKLISWADAVRAGDLDAEVEVGTRDEFGELGGSFNQMVGTLREQRTQMEVQNEENEALLLTVMPTEIAERIKAGEERIADEYPNVSVVNAQITGFDALTIRSDARVAADVLNDLADSADELAERHGIEKIKLNGAQYIAASGLLQPRLDHQRRAIEFATDFVLMVDAYSSQHATVLGGPLRAAIGVSSGEVEAGIIGRQRPVFDVWGATVSYANVLSDAAGPGEVVATAQIAEHLSGIFSFAERPSVDAGHTDIDCARLDGAARTAGAGPAAADPTPAPAPTPTPASSPTPSPSADAPLAAPHTMGSAES